MGLFKKEVAPEPEITGTRVIQLRLWSRWKKANLARTALDLNISLGQFEAFAKNEIDRLPAEQMKRLCREFYPYFTEFDPVADRLIDVSPPAAPAGGPPPEPYDPKLDPRHIPHDPNRHYGYPASGKSDPNAGRLPKRPGFAA